MPSVLHACVLVSICQCPVAADPLNEASIAAACFQCFAGLVSDQEQEQEIRQRVEFLSAHAYSDNSTSSIGSASTAPHPRRARRILLMMEAAERELEDWTAFLPGSTGRTSRSATPARSTTPACDGVSLHSVLGEVRARTCRSVAADSLLPAVCT